MSNSSHEQPSLPYKQPILKHHNREDTINSNLKCQLCSQVFETMELYAEHAKTFHNITVKPLEKGHLCQYCHKVMSTSSNLSSHIRIMHAKTSNFMCPQCRQPFLHRQRYKKHIENCPSQTS